MFQGNPPHRMHNESYRYTAGWTTRFILQDLHSSYPLEPPESPGHGCQQGALGPDGEPGLKGQPAAEDQ